MRKNIRTTKRKLGRGLLLIAGLILTLSLGAQGPPASNPHVPTDRVPADGLVLPPGPPPQARLVRAEDVETGDVEGTEGPPARNHLVLPGGMVFHRTDYPVHDLRTIGVPGSSIQLYLWDEEPAPGERQSFYAVSQAGTKLRGRVRPTTYNVRLRHHTFDPLRQGPPATPPGLAARQHNELYLVQFVTTPLPEFRHAITELGGKVLRFISDHTYVVEMTPGVRGQVAARLPYVRWIGEYQPMYRLEEPLREALAGQAPELAPQRYSIMLGEGGSDRQLELAAQIEGLGGRVELIEPGGLRLEATLSHEQLAEVVHADDVQFIDRWGGPGELDMDVVRAVGGADYLEGLEGWTGQGVNGEIFDTELRTTHQEWPVAPMIHYTPTSCASYHGTSCYSINFAQGIDPAARGMLPDGQGIFFCYAESTQFGGSISRYDANKQLIDPAGPFRAVFQTSSVGSSRTTDYTTISAEVDDYLFRQPILSTQSQSNAGNQMSRPQAWAKNIVAVGGVYHYGTADRSDDHWGYGASIGPADDGRIKPDLAYFYDGIHSASGSCDTCYTEFGGTSAATPETAGHFGILFQMWHEGVWPGHGGGGDVFDSRPQMATAKALMINNAYRYDWTLGGANGDIDRFKQGWGTADLRRLYDRAPVTSIIDESDLLVPLQTRTYGVRVDAGESELNVTMVYTDPAGTVGAAWARINDLSLRVISPSGTVYWGNNGLTAGNWSTPGGSSNPLDTVENVFISNPQAGTWTVEVIGDEIVEDAHLETPEIDADYALVVSGGLIKQSTVAPLPDYTYTYSYTSHTRGYWFTAPTDFVLTGLRVHDVTDHGLQNVAVVRFNPGVTPPTYSATTNAFTQLFRSVGVSSDQVIPTSIVIHAGEVIGILGAAGDASIMHNAYGNAPFTSEILGQPVTFTRLGMQHNLASSQVQDLFTSAGPVARVHMFYSALNEASLPAFSRTYSYVSHTRGFWFTAPRDFTIVGLQVPDEAAHGLQNVEVVRFNPGVEPPLWSGTTNAFTSLMRAVGLSSSQVIQVSIPVKKDDVIGILGAAGDASTMHNSYSGVYSFTSDIFGEPVTFRRLGMQYNLATSAAQNLWTENYNVGRVRMFYGQ